LNPPDDSPKGLLGHLHLDSIRNRILVLALLATLIPALSTALLSFQRTRRALTETLEGELQRAGSQSARELDLWEKERTYDLRVFVGSFEVSENLSRAAGGGIAAAEAPVRLTNYLTGIQNRFGDYAELLVIDTAGFPVASSLALSEADRVSTDWLPRLRAGETILGDPFLVPPAAVASDVAVPIESADGRFLGALVATLNFDAVSDLLSPFEPGEGGRIELVTAEGRRIAASTRAPGFAEVYSENALEALRATAGGTMEFVDHTGVEVVGTLTPVERIGWNVVVRVPTEEAYARIAQLRRTTFLLVSFLLVVVGTVAYFIGLLIVRPLDRLTAGASAVAGGDLSVDLPVSGRDEVALLTRVFNGMVSELRATRKKLDEAADVLREQNSELEQISITDALTSLFNRRYVMAEFDKEINRANRHGRNFAVLMLDVDKFKQYNDSWGHQAGDEVLRGMGVVIRDATREPDVPGRYGGEEFIVLMPDCDIRGAIDAGERIRRRLAQEVFDGRRVTASIGVAEYPTHGETAKALIGAADIALYQAKEQGRDRVIPAGQPAEATPKTPEPEAEGAPSGKEEDQPAKKAASKKKATGKATTKAAKKEAASKSDRKSAAKKESGAEASEREA